MAVRKFTKSEIIGCTVLIMVVSMFFYFKLFYDPTMRRYNRIHNDLEKISSEVEGLKEISKRGVLERDIRRLNSRLKKAKMELQGAETRLANGVEIDNLLMDVIHAASGCGLKSYNPLEREKLKEIGSYKKGIYERKFYKIILYGNFSRLVVFLEKINSLPKLVTVEKIDMEKTDKEKALKTTLLLSI
jgi:Tfp pilus assembly protein PilO